MRPTDPLDEVIGQRLRALRLERGLSQMELGAMIGASVHQVEQFETGARRIGAARLMRLAKVLDVDVSVFFGAADRAEEAVELEDLRPGSAHRVRHGRSVH